MIEAAGFVQMKGVWSSFQCAMYASMCSQSAALLGKCATPSDCFPRMPKKPSTWFSHDAHVALQITGESADGSRPLVIDRSDAAANAGVYVLIGPPHPSWNSGLNPILCPL